MRERELKEDLHRQLRGARAAVLGKLEGCPNTTCAGHSSLQAPTSWAS